MTRLAVRSFLVGAAAGLIAFAGFLAGLAAAERTGWPR
jgi:hypothetical protein